MRACNLLPRTDGGLDRESWATRSAASRRTPDPAIHDLQQRLLDNRLPRGGRLVRDTKVLCEEDLPEFRNVMVDVSLLVEGSGRSSGPPTSYRLQVCGQSVTETLKGYPAVCSDVSSNAFERPWRDKRCRTTWLKARGREAAAWSLLFFAFLSGVECAQAALLYALPLQPQKKSSSCCASHVCAKVIPCP